MRSSAPPSRRRVPFAVSYSLAVAVVSLAASDVSGCVDSSDTPSNGTDVDANVSVNQKDGSSGTDASTGTDAPVTTADTGADAIASDASSTDGAANDGSVTITNCTAPVRVDTLGAVLGAQAPSILAEAYGDKYVVTWHQAATITGDGKMHQKARTFDGTSFGSEVDLGGILQNESRFAQDGKGRGFMTWNDFTKGYVRATFDFATLTFGTPQPYVATFGGRFDLAGANGQGMSLYQNGGGAISVDRLLTDGGWQSTGLSVVANPFTTRVYLANGGTAITSWHTTAPVFTTYDGGAWGTGKSPTIDAGPAGDAYEHVAMFANGDAIVMFNSSRSIQTARFRAATATFDAPVFVDVQTDMAVDSQSRRFIVTDSQDRVTIVWQRALGGSTNFHTYASRSFDQGATWSAPVDFGPSNSVSLAVDPNDVVVAAIYGNGQNTGSGVGDEGIFLRAVAPTSTTWSAPVQTNIQTNQGGNYGALDDSARVLFDTKSQVTVVGLQYDPDAGIAYTVRATTCKL